MRRLFAELRRRNVFRVGIAYVVVGWLLVQITALAVPALATLKALMPADSTLQH